MAKSVRKKKICLMLWGGISALLYAQDPSVVSFSETSGGSLITPQPLTPYTLDNSKEGILDFGKIQFGGKKLGGKNSASSYYRKNVHKSILAALEVRFSLKKNKKHANQKITEETKEALPLLKLADIICTYFALYYKEDVRRLEKNPRIYARHFIALLKSQYFHDPQRFSTLLRESYFNYLRKHNYMDRTDKITNSKNNMLLADILYVEEKMGSPLLTEEQVELYQSNLQKNDCFDAVVRQAVYHQPSWSSIEHKSIKEILLQVLVKAGKSFFFPEKAFFKKNYSHYIETETMTILALCANKEQIDNFLKDYLTIVLRGLAKSIEEYIRFFERSTAYQSYFSFITSYLGVETAFLNEEWHLMKKIFHGYPLSKELVNLILKFTGEKNGKKPVISILAVEGDFKGIKLELDFAQMALAWFEGGDTDYLDPYFKDLCKIWLLKNREKSIKNKRKGDVQKKMKSFIRLLLNEIWENKHNPCYEIKKIQNYYQLSQAVRFRHKEPARYSQNCCSFYCKQLCCLKNSIKSQPACSCCSKNKAVTPPTSATCVTTSCCGKCSYDGFPKPGGQREVKLCCAKEAKPLSLRLCVTHCPGNVLCVCHNPYLTLCTRNKQKKEKESYWSFARQCMKKIWWVSWKGCCWLNSTLLKSMCNGFLDCLGFPKSCQKKFGNVLYCEGQGPTTPCIYCCATAGPPHYVVNIDKDLRTLATCLGKGSSFSLKAINNEVEPNPTRVTLRVSIEKERDQLLKLMNAKYSERPHFPRPSYDGVELRVGQLDRLNEEVPLPVNKKKNSHLTLPKLHQKQESFIILASSYP